MWAAPSLRTVAGVLFFRYYRYVTPAVTLSYKLKLYPTANKADTLALLSDLFRREHAGVTTRLADAEEIRLPSTKGLGEFIGRAYRRAYIDFQRTRKAGHTPGFLHAELIDSAEVQQPRKATGFDCWIMLRGTTNKPMMFADHYRGPRGMACQLMKEQKQGFGSERLLQVQFQDKEIRFVKVEDIEEMEQH